MMVLDDDYEDKEKQAIAERMDLMLLNNDWLSKKVNRHARLKEIRGYANTYLPEIKEGRFGAFVDIGPGPGELIELAMAYGMDAYGVDAETEEGGMGDNYLAYSRLSHQLHDLDVIYSNDPSVISSKFSGSCSIINMRGSIEQVLHKCLNGSPHHHHHDCLKLKWDEERGYVEIRKLLKTMREALGSGGILMIAGNGALNTAWYDKVIKTSHEELGYQRIVRFNERTHKLYV